MLGNLAGVRALPLVRRWIKTEQYNRVASLLQCHAQYSLYAGIATFKRTVERGPTHNIASRTNRREYCATGTGAGSLLELSPADFVKFLKENNIRRSFVVHDQETGKAQVSHPALQELAHFFDNDDVDYKEHEGTFMALGMRTGALMGAFVWRTDRGQACGGIRLWRYPTVERYLRDGLRLAFGMGVKSALAGLWAGGGKGVIAEPDANRHLDPEYRRNLFFDYGDFLTSLNGCYVAAEDVGITIIDLDNVHSRTRYTTCISEDLGGSGNPSVTTGKGVICAMEATLEHLDIGSLENKTVAIQGAGNVAVVVIEELLKKKVAKIYVSDCNQKRVHDVLDMFAGKADGKLVVEKVPLDCNEVLAYPCDILSPCALGNVLKKDTIERMQTKIVCGAANNQLGRAEDSQLMEDMGITYIPDFLANRMGIVNCANETYGRLPDDPAINRHFGRDWENSVFCKTKEILEKASEDKITPDAAAMAIADKMSRVDHPIWPGRSQKIIKSLVESGWHEGEDFWR